MFFFNDLSVIQENVFCEDSLEPNQFVRKVWNEPKEFVKKVLLWALSNLWALSFTGVVVLVVSF